MATLVSPGVQINLIDESFYGSAGPGTVPLLVIATASNKILPSGDGIASGTLPENAGKLYLITSQRELVQTFGEPLFYSNQGTQLHGYELNEYGLLAAYQYLGIANRIYVIRANTDLSQLAPNVFEPRNEATHGQYWVDVAETSFGLFANNGGTVPGLSWDALSPIIVDRPAEQELVMRGTEGFAANSSTVTTGTLSINGQTVTISATPTVASIVADINNAGIPGIEAQAVRLNSNSYVTLFDSLNNGIEVSGTLVITLGLDDAFIVPSPIRALGLVGDVAINVLRSDNVVFQKVKPKLTNGSADADAVNMWTAVGGADWVISDGSSATKEVFYASHTQIPQTGAVGDLWVKTTSPNLGANWSVKRYNVTSGQWATLTAPLYANDDIASVLLGSSAIPGTIYTQYNIYDGNFDYTAFAVKRYLGAGTVAVTSTKTSISGITNGDSFTLGAARNVNGAVVVNTATISFTSNPTVTDVRMLINNAAIPGVVATVEAGYLVVTNSNQLSLVFENVNGNPLAAIGIEEGSYSRWEYLNYEASVVAPTSPPSEGQLWYNPDFRVDIMVNDPNQGDEWLGYKTVFPNTDPEGVILGGSQPLTQRDGTPLVEADLWIDTTDLENYPRMYRFRASTNSWEEVDTSDQTTPFGVVFADARYTSNGQVDGSQEIENMLISDFVDPDAPDPRTFPGGMLLFNTRYSTYNVKEWKPNYFSGYVGQELDDEPGEQYSVGDALFAVDTITHANMGRWVTLSGNNFDGSGIFGRHAQRIIAVRGMASVIVENQDIRSENLFFNLIAAPGYPELIDEMVTLNTDKKEIAFIVADTPSRLQPTATAIQAWATNANNAASNGDKGLTTRNTYVGLYYPWGLSTNLDGAEVVIPPSAVALRTIAYSDFVSYPWFAPAGIRRGMVTNAASVGYITAEDEYQPVYLSPGARDALYLNNINPITFVQNNGLSVFGQKTLHPANSALDRINVVRLVNYLRFNLDIIGKPFLFEPNDKTTRDEVKATFERWLGNLISLRAIEDFAIQCDETNNTPIRIDRNELWIDIGIIPIKAVEFIYIPLRMRNTGDSLEFSTNA